MPSHREQVVQTFVDALAFGLPGVDVQRNRDKPQKVNPAGDIIVRDGDPGDPEETLNPPRWHWSHAISIEVGYRADDREAGLDALLMKIGDIIDADRTLGGLCQYIEPTAPRIDSMDAAGVTGARWADFNLVANYVTTSPLK